MLFHMPQRLKVKASLALAAIAWSGLTAQGQSPPSCGYSMEERLPACRYPPIQTRGRVETVSRRACPISQGGRISLHRTTAHNSVCLANPSICLTHNNLPTGTTLTTRTVGPTRTVRSANFPVRYNSAARHLQHAGVRSNVEHECESGFLASRGARGRRRKRERRAHVRRPDGASLLVSGRSRSRRDKPALSSGSTSPKHVIHHWGRE